MSWLHHNRWWLPLVPVCLVVMLVASGYRVKPLWYYSDLHRVEASAGSGSSVTVTDHYDDAYGATSRTFTVRFTSMRQRRRMPGFAGPGDPPAPGTQALAATFDWSADADQSLSRCSVALVDDRGRRYELPIVGFHADSCVPEDHGGPEPADAKDHPRGYAEAGTERPPRWEMSLVFQIPDDAHITKALVWWDKPYYVELAAP